MNVTSTAKKMVPAKGVYLSISKLHSNLAVENLLAHNIITIYGFKTQCS